MTKRECLEFLDDIQQRCVEAKRILKGKRSELNEEAYYDNICIIADLAKELDRAMGFPSDETEITLDEVKTKWSDAWSAFLKTAYWTKPVAAKFFAGGDRGLWVAWPGEALDNKWQWDPTTGKWSGSG